MIERWTKFQEAYHKMSGCNKYYEAEQRNGQQDDADTLDILG